MSPLPLLDVVTVGEAMALFIAGQAGGLAQATHFHRATAGAELNVAVGLRRLGLSVGYVSRVGNDSFGQHLLAFLDAEGIDRRHVQTDQQHPTGFMLKTLETDGKDPAIEYFRRGSAASHLNLADYPQAYCTASRHLHLTGISPGVSASLCELVFEMAAQARLAGRSVSFDPNLRPRLWPSPQVMAATMNRLAASADLVMPGLSEGQLLTGLDSMEAIADFYLEGGAKQVVIKLGAEGAYFADQDGRGIVPGIPVKKVVDTVGAGDGFAVGVISGLLEGLRLPEAVARGNVIGARVVQFPGDCDGLPTREQLRAMLAVSQ
ncbi:sugar kinase [Herbaspirillum sp. RTI4]|uniref:sugar kinase n=1 Tax=Herbaspirillum sp. RTI4 TaxID=3048640 RepID=UPI002AB59C46|nr:sugar kinase [Herbaspirillum sp. RTI4]MDY7579004.1 sugar kinase [Herbaspirillum sp. RTI4]MEA9980935.1 sugar kinase [Herbaspirillum sp. RTI4]